MVGFLLASSKWTQTLYKASVRFEGNAELLGQGTSWLLEAKVSQNLLVGYQGQLANVSSMGSP